MLKKLTRAEAHKTMDEGKTLWDATKNWKVYRADVLAHGPYVKVFCQTMTERYDFDFDLFIDAEEPWRPVEGEAIYYRDGTIYLWRRGTFSHIENDDTKYIFCVGVESFAMIAPVKGNEGSAGTTKELKNALTAEDLK